MDYLLDEFGLGFILHSENNEIYLNFKRNPDETKWIALSSSFFGIPGIWYLAKYVSTPHPLIQPILIYSVLLILTTLFSINYWRDAQVGWRRNVDLILSKITFTVGGLCNLFYVNYLPLKVATFTVVPFIWYSYRYSSYLTEQSNPEWVTYHFTFHILLAIGAIFILRGMEINKK